MSSTVTTTTVTTVTTATFFGTATFVVILALLIFLIKKEIVSSTNDPRAKVLSRILNVVILPLFLAFSAIATTQLVMILS